MVYATIENGVVSLIARPNWLNEDGTPLSDQQLIEHAVFPVVFDRPVHDPNRERLEQNPQNMWRIESASVTVTYYVHKLGFEQIRTQRLAQINLDAQKDADRYKAGYPQFEIDTWPTQKAEAETWSKDNGAATPWIDIAAAKRKISREDFIGRVLVKTAVFVQASATISGYRQDLEDQIDSIDPEAPTAIDQLLAIYYVSPLDE